MDCRCRCFTVAPLRHRSRGCDWDSQSRPDLNQQPQDDIADFQGLPELQQLKKLPLLWQKLHEEQSSKPHLKWIFEHSTAHDLDASLWRKVKPDNQAGMKRRLEAQSVWLLELYAELELGVTNSPSLSESVCHLLDVGCPWSFVMTATRHYSHAKRPIRAKYVKPWGPLGCSVRHECWRP
jgi:hypothetical protein